MDDFGDPEEPGGAVPEGTTAVIDRLVWHLSGGDLVKGLEIYGTVTMCQALEWMVVSLEGRD